MFTQRRLLQILSVTVILSMMFSAFSTPVALAQRGDGVKRQHNAQTGKVNFIGPESGRVLSATKALGISPSTRPADPALALAKRFGPEFGLKNPARDLKKVKNKPSNNNRMTVHYQQSYQGIPVIGGELIVNTNENGDLYSINGEISPDISLSTQPTVDSEQARQTALGGAAKWYQKAPEDFVTSDPELWIYDESLLQPSTRPVELVWRMDVMPKDTDMPVRELVLINAHRGNISLHFNQLDTAWSLSGKTDTVQDLQPTSTPQPTETLPSTEVPTDAPETISIATPTPTPIKSDEETSTLDSKSGVESLIDGIWYVSTTGNDSNSCSEPALPCATIQAAINKASSGNTIEVAAGTYYYTSINVNPNVVIINKSLTLSGGWEGDFSGQTGASTIDGQNTNNGILANAAGSTVVVERFVIQNSHTGSDSGGIYLYGANFTLRNSSIINNTGGRGAGIFMIGNANLTVLNSTISGNRAGSSGGGLHAVNGTITINNSTIAYNNSNVTGGGIRKESGTALIRNSLLVKNTATTSSPNCAGSIESSDHNIIENAAGCTVTPGTGDQFGVDALIDAALAGALPLHALQTTSPAINAGDSTTCLATDQRGIARPQGSTCDIGAYELVTSNSISVVSGSNQSAQVSTAFALPLSVLVINDLGDPASGVTVTFSAPASGASGTFADTGINVTTAITGSNGVATSAVLTANGQTGEYVVNATVASYDSPAIFDLSNTDIPVADFYVSPNGVDSNSCNSPAAPCLTINAAINKASPDDIIAVAAGTYAPASIAKSLILLGGWDSSFDSQTGYSIVQSSNATVDAISTTGTLVSISRFVAQSSRYGIYHNGGTLSFAQGALINNKNGIYNYSGDVTFTNTTISGNTGSMAGSAISNVNGTVRIQSSTISNNGGTEALQSTNGAAHIEIGNSILAGNSGADCRIGSSNLASNGHNIFGRSPACSGSTSFVPASTDRLGTDPQLSALFPVGYHPISPTSPAVDQGNPASCPATDQRGVTRPQGTACDIGAYEYTAPGAAASFGVASGSSQHSGPSLPFLLPLAVYVMDAAGSPASGVPVTFTAPASGSGGTFADTHTNITVATTNDNGIAIASMFIANSQIGSYNVVATVTGLSGSASFALVNAVWFVAPTGSDTNSCSLPSSPCLTINGAITKAVDGDAIKVAVGIYGPTGITKSLTLLGGWDNTFSSQTGYSTVQGSTTLNGISASGTNVSITRFVIQNSRYGIYHSAGTLSFAQGALLRNGNGIYNSSGDTTFTNTTISGNDASSGTSGSAISNNSGIVRIQYSTITNNTSSYALYSTNSGARIEIGNSVLAGNSGADCYVGSTNMASAGHNIFGRSPACSGSTGFVPDPSDQLGVNPQLSALFPLGYYPTSPTSPTMDQGNLASCPATDQRGAARPQGAACDIGAYEYMPAGPAVSFGIASGSNQHSGSSLPFLLPLVVYVMDAAGTPVDGVTVTFTAPVSGPSGTFADTGTNTTSAVTTDGIATASVFIANSQTGSYNVAAAVTGLSDSASFALTNATWFVAPTGSDTYSCNSPASPCLTINGAIGKAADGDAIRVAVGTYGPTSIAKSLTLLGGWDNAFSTQTGYSTVQGSATVDGISTSGTNVFISRFVVQNSKYGIYHNEGTLSFVQGALITNKNGIYNYRGNTTFTNMTISGNSASGTAGSAISNINGTIRIQYSTISNNSGWEAISSQNGGANIIIGDSILAGNPNGDCRVGSTNMTSAGHNIFGRSPACSDSPGFVPDPTDQLGVNPQLSTLLPLGYHSLSPASPAVNHANPDSCPAIDQRGAARPQGTACDIGAYEYMPTGAPASFGIASGGNQRPGPALPLLIPLAVYVMDDTGNPASGVTVTFTAPSSGPSGTFADSGTHITLASTNSAGIATASVFTANSQLGSYNVTATVAGLTGSVSFALTNAAWFVSPTGNNGNSCNSPASPCLTINGAVGKAAEGDAILVAVGTYAPAGIAKSLMLSGGWDNTFSAQTGYSIIQGTTTSDGISVSGTIISISRFIVQNSDDGIYHTGGTLNFERGALLRNNDGIYNSGGDATLTNTTLSGNLGHAVNTNGGTVHIRYSTIANNTGSYAVYSVNTNAHVEIGDSILAGNQTADCYAGSNNMTSTGHNIFGRSPACGPYASFVPDSTDQAGVDPQLSVLLAGSHYALAFTSPAVDHANPASCPAIDQRGVTRPQGTACDIGAYEYTVPGAAASFGIVSGSNQRTGPSLPFSAPLAVYVIDAAGSPVSGATVTFTAPASGPSGTFADTGTNIGSALSSDGFATSPVFTANAQLGSYTVVATIAGLPGSAGFGLTNAAWFVSPTGSDSNSCNSPSSPCQTIGGAVGKATNGDAIKVTVGTYSPISISKSLALLGGWDNTFSSQVGYSIVNGTSTTDGLTVSGTEVSISRFIVQNSYVGIRHNGGTLHFDQGASINNSNGLYNYDGDLTFTNTTISGNYARATQGVLLAGSAISNVDGLIKIQYSTITNNGGTEAVWSVNGSAQIEMGNSILTGNPGGDCAPYGINLTSVGHNILGSASLCGVAPRATDQIGVDPKLFPLFPSGYHPLLPGSPAINAADPLDCLAVDQRGVARPAGTACDIGSVEYTPTGTTPKYILAYQGSSQIIVINSPAASRLVAVVFDEIGNSVQGRMVTFTAPDHGASVIFADTGTNTSTAVTDVSGLAVSPAFSANNLAGSYSVAASVDGADIPAGFSLSNSTIAVNPRIQTYTANNETTLPGTFLCDQTKPGCTNGGDPHADAAHQYALGTYAFYAAQYNRNSIDNAGMTIISSVHVSSGYANAGWNGSQMIYGDAYGFALADDVVGHELTHGVTQYESNLFYFYQSGAINESFSDLWGEYYDQTNGMGNDSTAVKWRMGEDVSGLGALRSFSNPPDFGDPDKMSSPNYYLGTSDNGGVHTNSGINNKAIFLMVEGGSFNGKTVTALGWEKIAAIYYEANTNLLSSGADYSDLYYTLQQACTNLIGQKGITAGDCEQVRNALDAVEMNGQPVANYNADAPYCDDGNSPAVLFSDDLELGTGNWTFSNGASPRWQLDSSYGPNAHSGAHSLYADDYPDTVTDASARLVAVSIPSNAYLHFAHAYEFDANSYGYFDGGVLEYSTDGGLTWLDADALIDFNGYKGIIYTGYKNPLQGRSAFVGSSHGYISTRLNLASLAGETVSFRWRMGLDQVLYAWGWWLDDIKIYRCLPADTTLPTIVSIHRAGMDPAATASVDFTVTFSEPVTSVDVNDFDLDLTGNITGASITSVAGSGSTWTVFADTGSGDGTLGLEVPVGADIRDLAGNSLEGLPFTGENYTIDKTAPVVSSIVRAGPDHTAADSVGFTVTFSEPVTGVDTTMPFSDFTLRTTDVTGAAIASVSGSGAIWTVMVNTGSGDGTLGLDLNVDTNIADLSGNLLKQSAFTPDEEYAIEKTRALLIAPVDGELLLHRRPTFDWSDVAESSGYRISASNNSLFDAVLWEVDTTDSTYIPSADLPGGQVIYWRVRAQVDEGWGLWSETWSFTTGNPPSIPVLASPANASLTRDYTPLLDWNNSTVSTGAAAFDHYEVQVATDTLFTDPVLIDEGTTTGQISASSYTPTTDLAANTTYFWRVRSYNVSGQYSSWSTVRSFRTALLPPSDLTPDGGVTVSNRKPILDWNAVAGAEGYNIQVSTSSSFGSLLVNTSTTTDTFTPTSNLPAHRTIYWRVRTTGTNGPSSWTTAVFKTP